MKRKRLYITLGTAASLLICIAAGFYLGHRHASSKARMFEVAIVADELVHTTVALEHLSPEQSPEAHSLLKRRVVGAATKLNLVLNDCPPAFGACQQALSGLTYLSRNPDLIQFVGEGSGLTNKRVKESIESAIRKATPLRDEGLRRELRSKYSNTEDREAAFRKIIEKINTQQSTPGNVLKAALEE